MSSNEPLLDVNEDLEHQQQNGNNGINSTIIESASSLISPTNSDN